MCDGSSLSDTRGGIRKPVALVRMVNSRKIAVTPGAVLEPSIPDITIRPATMAIRLMITWTIVNVAKLIPRIMMPSPLRTFLRLRRSGKNCQPHLMQPGQFRHARHQRKQRDAM